MSNETQERQKLIDLKEVCRTTGLSKSYVYELEGQGKFPARLKFGKASRWVEAEVQHLIRQKMSDRDRHEPAPLRHGPLKGYGTKN
jgi:prophage regulatory protein